MTTAPYDERAPQDLVGALGHRWVVTCAGVPLEVVNGTITFDESWSPHVQASLTCRLPADLDDLALMDPRLDARLLISVGYVYADDPSHPDVHPLVDLKLVRRSVRRPQNDVILEASSEEIRAQLRTYGIAGGADAVGSTRTALLWLIEQVYRYTILDDPTVVVTIPWDLGADITWNVADWLPDGIASADTYWSLISSVADTWDVWVYHDGLSAWHIAPRPDLSTPPAAILKVGGTGTLTGIDADLAIDEGWGNAVTLTHEWETSGGTKYRRTSRAYLDSSEPTSPAAVGHVTRNIRRTTPISVESIQKSSRNLLRRVASRGEKYGLTAPSAYWLRPGKTVSAQVVGGTAKQLVASVSFRYPSGDMTVTTRKPQDFKIEGE